MANNTVKFLITGDAAGLEAAAAKGEASVNKLGTTGDKLGKAVSTGAKIAVAGLVGFAAESVKVALEGEKSQAILTQAIKNTGANVAKVGPQFDALAESQAKYGQTADQSREALATLVTATGSTTQAEKLLQTTEDISAAKHISSAAAAKLVGKVAEGNVGSLGRFGLATKDAAGNTLTAAAAMQELTTKFHGVADAVANTPAGKLAAFKAQFEDLEEEVGNKLLPVITRFGSDALSAVTGLEHGFNDLSGPIKTTIEVVAGAAAGALVLAKGYGLVKTAVGTVGQAYRDVSGFVKGFGASNEAAADETVAATEQADTGIASLGTTFQTVGADIAAAVDAVNVSIESLGATATEIAGYIEVGLLKAEGGFVSLGTSAEESATVTATAFAGIGADAEALAATIQEAKAASDVGVWGAGGFAGGTGGGAGGGTPVVVPPPSSEGTNILEQDASEVGGVGAGVVAGKVAGRVGGSVAEEAGGAAADVTFGSALRAALGPAAIAALLTGGDSGPSKSGQQIVQQYGVKYAQKLETGDISDLKSGADGGKGSQDYKSAEAQVAGLDAAIEQHKAIVQASGNVDNIVAGQVKSFGLANSVAQTFVNGLTGSVKTNTGAVRDNGTVTSAQAASLKTYGSNLTATLNPALSAIQAEQGLTQAKQNQYLATIAVDQAAKQYGKNSPQYLQAEQALTGASSDRVNAAINEQTSLANLAQTYQAGGKTVDDFKNVLQGLVSQGAISQDQANGMTLAFALTSKSLDGVAATADGATTSLDKIPKEHAIGLSVNDQATPKITTVGGLVDALQGKRASVTIGADVSTAIANLDYLQSAIQAAARTDPSLYVTLTGHTQSNQGVVRRASGGLLRAGQLSTVGENGIETARAGGQTYLLSNQDVQITPNSQIPRVSAAGSAGQYAPAGGGDTYIIVHVNVPVSADKGAVGQEVAEALEAFRKQGGGSVLKTLVGV